MPRNVLMWPTPSPSISTWFATVGKRKEDPGNSTDLPSHELVKGAEQRLVIKQLLCNFEEILGLILEEVQAAVEDGVRLHWLLAVVLGADLSQLNSLQRIDLGIAVPSHIRVVAG